MHLISDAEFKLLKKNVPTISENIVDRAEKKKPNELIKTESETQQEPTSDEINNVTTEYENVSEPKSESDFEPKLDSDSEPKSDSDSEPKLDSDSEPKSDSKPKPNPKPEPPTLYFEDVKDIVAIVLKFVSDKKLKVYGGYAHNKTVINKNPKDAFYGDNDLPDIDVMSTTPIKHMVEMCDILEKKGFAKVSGAEAIHEGTYRVIVDTYIAMDLSYTPTNIYNSIPFIRIDNINYVHPRFAMLDLFKMITDPHFSSWRWSEKTVPRLFILQKNYPIQKSNKYLDPIVKHKKNVDGDLQIIFDYLKNKDDIIMIGDYVYNHYVKISKIQKDNKLIKEIKVPYYEFIAINYTNTVLEMINLLKKNKSNITIVEYYPYLSLTDFSVKVYSDDELIAIVYGNNCRCTPVKKVKIDETNFLTFGCFDFVFLTTSINMFRMKTNNDAKKKLYYETQSQNLIEIKNYYLKKIKKNILDDTIFQSFLDETTCIGPIVDVMKETWAKRKKKKKEGKRMMFTYKPIKEITTVWVFKNSSGNAINNIKNKKITNLLKK